MKLTTTSLPLFLLLLCRSVALRSFVAIQCPSAYYSPNINYSSNLSRLLQRWVLIEGRISFFYNITEGNPPNTVYGHFLCRPDITADACLSCINFGNSEILMTCPGKNEVIIWYDECLLRYSNRSFFSLMESAPPYRRYVEAKFPYPDILGVTLARMVQNTTDLAIASNTRYATSRGPGVSFMKMNVRAQCTPDLSRPDCRICLNEANNYIRMLTSIKQSYHIYLPSCYLQYEISNSIAQAPLPGPDRNTTTDLIGKGRKASVQMWVVTSATAGACLLMIFSGLRVLVKQINKDNRQCSLKFPNCG